MSIENGNRSKPTMLCYVYRPFYTWRQKFYLHWSEKEDFS